MLESYKIFDVKKSKYVSLTSGRFGDMYNYDNHGTMMFSLKDVSNHIKHLSKGEYRTIDDIANKYHIHSFELVQQPFKQDDIDQLNRHLGISTGEMETRHMLRNAMWQIYGTALPGKRKFLLINETHFRSNLLKLDIKLSKQILQCPYVFYLSQSMCYFKGFNVEDVLGSKNYIYFANPQFGIYALKNQETYGAAKMLIPEEIIMHYEDNSAIIESLFRETPALKQLVEGETL